MPDINGIPYVESTDLVSGWPTVSQSVAQEVSDQLASKLPYAFGTATPTTSDEGFLWYDENETPPAPKFWDGAAFQALTSGKILQIVRATDTTDRSTTSGTFVDASISVTITPQKSDSAVLLIWATTVRPQTNGLVWLIITDASNNQIGGNRIVIGGTNLTAGSFYVPVIAYATPATTSATTYKGRFAAEVASPATLFNSSWASGQMYALEISA